MSYAEAFAKIFDNTPMSPNYKVNTDRTAVVSTDYSFNDDMMACPRGNKVLLLGSGGTASISEYHGEAFWIGWFPLPRRKVKRQPSQT